MHLSHEPVVARIDRSRRVGVDAGQRARGIGVAGRERERHDGGRQQQGARSQRPARRAAPRVPAARRLPGVEYRWRELECGVVLQDRPLEPPQLGPGLDARSLDEQRPSFAVALERVGLPSGAVEREHELRARALA